MDHRGASEQTSGNDHRLAGCGEPRRAYSLLELVISLTILAVLSGIAVPRYMSSVERYRADATARRIIDDLAYARSRARSTSAVRTVVFDTGLERYQILEELDLDHGVGTYTVDLTREPYRAVVDSASFDDPLTADPLDTVVFDAYGQPDSGGTVVVRAGSSTVTVVLDADTGRAEVP